MVGKAIRELRLRERMTLNDLGERVGVSHVSIARYESGERTPRLKTLQVISEVFGMTVGELEALGKALEHNEFLPITPGMSEPFDLERWRVVASMAEMDWRARLLLGILPTFLDRESGIVAITRDQAITRAHLTEEFVDAAFPIVLESGFVERIGEVEYMLRLKMPYDDQP